MPNNFEHVTGAESLRYLPNYLFGTQDVPKDFIKSVNDYMDKPVQPVGEGGMLGYTLHSGPHSGQFVTPNTHRDLNHDPFKVSKTFSGDGNYEPDSYSVAEVHRQMDFNKIDRWLINNGLPGTSQFEAAATFNAIGKGLFSAFENFNKCKNNEITIGDAIYNVTKDTAIGGVQGVTRLGASAAIHYGVMQTGSEFLKNVSASGGALAAGYTVCELGVDMYKYFNGELSGENVAVNAVRNITKSTVSLYTAKIGAAVGIMGGPVGVAAGALIGGVVGGVITDQVILTIIEDLKMKPEDFIHPLGKEDLEIVRRYQHSMFQTKSFVKSVEEFVGFISTMIVIDKVFDKQFIDINTRLGTSLLLP